MHVPKHFHFEDPQEIRHFIQRYSFGLLISNKPDGVPIATHIPMMLLKNSNDQEVLVGHIARANEQWHYFEQNPKVLAVFQGPHAFVSSSWYAKENVSTWNYLAVHVNGVLSFIDSIFLMESLKELTDKYEHGEQQPRMFHQLSPAMVKLESKGLVAFQIEITNIQATAKLSQNRNDEDYFNIIKELELKGDSNSIEIAREMRLRRIEGDK